MTALSHALSIAASSFPVSTPTFLKSSATVDANIQALRNFGSTRFVMIEMGSRDSASDQSIPYFS